MKKIAVIGAGLAGCECAWVLAQNYDIPVTLFEMKSKKMTPAQVAPHLFCELVCSNSLKSTSPLNPAGILKNEMQKLGSLVVPCAQEFQVPAGETLAVDREKFSHAITQKLRNHKNITVVESCVDSIKDLMDLNEFSNIVVATGPLTEDNLAKDLLKITGSTDLYFYDALAPILDGSTIDTSIVFKANRATRTQEFMKKQGLVSNENENDTGDYLNIPLDKAQYENFVNLVLNAPKVPHHNFEEPKYFNGCQPIENLAQSGIKTLAFGPMKPKGLTDPRTQKMPYAVVQLRKEKCGDEAWNMVGFQTRMTWTAQKEILRTLPGLQNVEFFRLGSMHRNTYMIAPKILNSDFSFKTNPNLYLAGQIMGVEGYIESAAMGLFIGHVIGKKVKHGVQLNPPPSDTSLGALCHYCIHAEEKKFTPMNIHWGLFSALTSTDFEKYGEGINTTNKKHLDKSVKRSLMGKRAEDLFNQWFQRTIS